MIARTDGLEEFCRRYCSERLDLTSGAAQQRGIPWAAAAIGHSEQVCREHYISPLIYQPPSLVDALPRPTF